MGEAQAELLEVSGDAFRSTMVPPGDLHVTMGLAVCLSADAEALACRALESCGEAVRAAFSGCERAAGGSGVFVPLSPGLHTFPRRNAVFVKPAAGAASAALASASASVTAALRASGVLAVDVTAAWRACAADEDRACLPERQRSGEQLGAGTPGPFVPHGTVAKVSKWRRPRGGGERPAGFPVAATEGPAGERAWAVPVLAELSLCRMDGTPRVPEPDVAVAAAAQGLARWKGFYSVAAAVPV